MKLFNRNRILYMMNRLGVVVTMASLLIVAGCWFKKDATADTQEPKLRVINVLDASLYNDSHIKGSEHVNFFELAEKVADWNKNTPIVVYCSNYACTASGDAVRQLSALGFTQVYAYEGGMAEWFQLSRGTPDRPADALYAIDESLPSAQGYLTVVMQKPEREVTDIKVVTAPELKQMMQDAQLL